MLMQFYILLSRYTYCSLGNLIWAPGLSTQLLLFLTFIRGRYFYLGLFSLFASICIKRTIRTIPASVLIVQPEVREEVQCSLNLFSREHVQGHSVFTLSSSDPLINSGNSSVVLTQLTVVIIEELIDKVEATHILIGLLVKGFL